MSRHVFTINNIAQVLQTVSVKELEFLVKVFNLILAVHLIQTQIIFYIFSKLFHLKNLVF